MAYKPRFYQTCKFWCIIATLIPLGFWVSAVAENEGCPEVNVVQNLLMDQFLGRWYQMFRMEQSSVPGQTGDCVIQEMTLREDFFIKLVNSGVGPDGERKYISGRARWSDIPFGKLDVKYGAFAPWSTYQVLDTDYISYAIVHSCSVALGAWTQEDTQVLVRFPSSQDQRLWKKQLALVTEQMDEAFVDKDKLAEMKNLVENFEAVKQAGDCTYPNEPEFENPQMDNQNDQENFM